MATKNKTDQAKSVEQVLNRQVANLNDHPVCQSP